MVIDTISRWIGARGKKLRAWEDAAPGRDRGAYWRAYTLVFLVFCAIALIAYPLNGRAILWSVDGLEQYYPFFLYEGEWLRGIIVGLFTGQGLQIPLWEWNMGYGSDVLLTFDIILDPINALSILAPGSASQWMYQFTIVLRLYLTGWAFSLLMLQFGSGRFATLVGALVYTFSATSLIVCVWPGASVPMILFPLLLLGAEKMLAGGKPWVYFIAAYLFFSISYYFSYMAVIMLVAYLAVRVVQVHGRNVGTFLAWAAKYAGCLVLAAALAAWILVPEVQIVLSMDRVTASETVIDPLYSLLWYQQIFGGFVGMEGAGSDCYIGYGGIALIACILLFSERKRHRALKVCFIAMTVMVCLPLAGSIMNGFNYATNRWVWAYALVIGAIVTIEVPRMLALSKREVKFTLSGVLVYALIVFLLPGSRTEEVMAALLVCALTCSVLFYHGIALATRRAALLCCTALAVGVMGFYFIDAGEAGWAAQSLPIGTMYEKLTTDSQDYVVTQVEDDGYWRYDASPLVKRELGIGYARIINNSLVLGLSGIDFYCSLYNDNIDRFHTEMGVAEDNINFMYSTLGARTILDQVCGVKYYLYPLDGIETTPFNYGPEKTVAKGIASLQECAVVACANPLPIGYTYDSVIARSAYLAMTPAQRQQALLMGAVVEDEAVSATGLAPAESAASAGLAETTVPYTVVDAQGVRLEGNTIHADQAYGYITLQLAGALPDAETYLYFDNLRYTDLLPSQRIDPAVVESYPWYRKLYTVVQDLNYSSITDYFIYAQADKGAELRRVVNSVDTWHMYGGKSTWLLNLGYAKEAQSFVTLRFNNPGVYTFDGMEIVCQPMGGVNARIDALGADTLQNLQRATNQLSGSIDLATRKMLYVSVPYSTGWTCTVDGVPADVLKTNTAFMGVMLDAGHHDVRFTYETPGLRTGGLITLVGVGILVIGVVISWLRRRAK